MRPEQSLSIPSAPGHSMYLITCRGAVLRRMRRMSASVTPNPCKPCPSRSTRAEDQGRKRKVYASLGVGEYWLFDPTGDYLAPRLQGFSLHAGEYRPLASVTPVSGGLSLHSEALGLDVGIDEDGRLRIHDPVSGKDLLAHDEEVAARQATETVSRTRRRIPESRVRDGQDRRIRDSAGSRGTERRHRAASDRSAARSAASPSSFKSSRHGSGHAGSRPFLLLAAAAGRRPRPRGLRDPLRADSRTR